MSSRRRSSPPPEGCPALSCARGGEGGTLARRPTDDDQPSPSPSKRPLGATPPLEGTRSPAIPSTRCRLPIDRLRAYQLGAFG